MLGDTQGVQYLDKLIDICKTYEARIEKDSDNTDTLLNNLTETLNAVSIDRYDMLETVESLILDYVIDNPDIIDSLPNAQE